MTDMLKHRFFPSGRTALALFRLAAVCEKSGWFVPFGDGFRFWLA